MQNRGVFITGTDTDVGKTRIAAEIASKLFHRGVTVIPKKPIESGCLRQDGQLIPCDAMLLIKAARYQGLLTDVCPYPFEPAISPVRAAKLANKSITTEQLVSACQHDGEKDFILVEGAGGFYSPLTTNGLNADLAVALQLPVVLVAENKLGAIGQVIVNAEAIDRRGLQLACVIINTRIPDLPEQFHLMDNVADVREQLSCPVFATPYSRNDSVVLAEATIDAILTASISHRPELTQYNN